jgi:hypothetical protein
MNKYTMLAALLFCTTGSLMADTSLHPPFELLNTAGQPVLEAGGAPSLSKSCTPCHDTNFIEQHSSHIKLGPRDTSPDGLMEWLQDHQGRHPGGGEFRQLGMEHDCFLCHLPGYDAEARRSAILAGAGELAIAAGLESLGLSRIDQDGVNWQAAAFDRLGNWPVDTHPMSDPKDVHCGACHPLVHKDPAALEWPVEASKLPEWGMVWSPQRIKASAINIEGKQQATRSWDVHAERMLECISCHHSGNHPAYRLESRDTRPDHLRHDGRRMDISDYLHRPLHNLSASGHLVNGVREPGLSCTTCHDPAAGHEWLPYARRHQQRLSCEACHIPLMHAPGLQEVDWTALDADGQPLKSYHGADQQPTSSSYQQNWTPLLLINGDGRETLHPVMVGSEFEWVDGDHAVSHDILRQVWKQLENETPTVFDQNHDGLLTVAERRIDNAEKARLISERLFQLGVEKPRITGRLTTTPLYHGVAGFGHALKECSACHSPEGRFESTQLAWSHLPHGAELEELPDKLLRVSENGVTRASLGGELYVLGSDAIHWVDLLGILSVIGVVLGSIIHGILRYRNRHRRHSA